MLARLERVDKEMSELQKEENDETHALNGQVTALLHVLAGLTEQEVGTKLTEDAKLSQYKLGKENQSNMKKVEDKHAVALEEL